MSQLTYIGPEDVAGKLNWRMVVDAIEAGHRLPKAELADQFLTSGGRTLLSRAAWIDGMGFGVKSVSHFPDNPGSGLPSVQGVMAIFDEATGAPTALVDGPLVTNWKTAADSTLGARYLARSDSRRLLVLGAGVVARNLAAAYGELFPGLTEFAIWNRTIAKAESLAEELRRQGLNAKAEPDLAKAAGHADIISSATASHEPVLRGEWVRPGTHVDLIGAFTASMREADDGLMRKARLFVDSRDTTIHHIGELMIPLSTGAIAESDILADLYGLVAGHPGRRDAGDITVFKNGGGAHLDLMTAGALIAAAAR